MAKKEQRPSKTSRRAKKKFSKEVLYKADEIVAEIEQKMKDILVALDPPKQFSPGALSEWKPKLKNSVATNLNAGQIWEVDESKVIEVAEDMARIAAILSADDSVVNKARAHGAFRAVKTHKKCPGTGGGAWCDFD